MPFKETCPMEERIALLRDHESGVFTVSDLCRRYAISRETFYVWKRRRDSGEERWFEERSHAVGRCAHATAGGVADRIVTVRRRFGHFGPKKIKAWLEREAPEVTWPAASTIGDILKREGLVEPKRRRRRAIGQGETVTPASAPNEEWAIDFKGWFRTGDGRRCDPLTISDAASRYLIELRIVEPTCAGVRDVLERIFAEIGMPAAIRSDNGAPFGSTGAGGLSALSVWWLKLGIEPRYIPPASPQDNGRHERIARSSAPPSPPQPPRASSRSASTVSAGITTRRGRTRRSGKSRRRRRGDRRPAPCRRASTTPGMTPITKADASVPQGRSNGTVTRCSSARRWPASSSASPSTTTAAPSPASAAAISVSSTATAVSCALLRRERGSAPRSKRR
jgi:Integrase core domain/Helix-turn-helix domain